VRTLLIILVVLLVVVILGVGEFFAGRALLARVRHDGSDAAAIHVVAAQIASFHVPRAYRLVGSTDVFASKAVQMWSMDDEWQFNLQGSLNDLDPNLTADVLNWKVRGCGGMLRRRDVRYESFHRHVMAIRFECRNRDYRLDIVPAEGRMPRTHVLAEGPSIGWPTRALDNLLRTVHP
jgi:hypothetical protein